GEIGGCLAQNLVRAPQLEVLALELLQPLALIARDASPLAGVRLRSPHPLAQGLIRAAELPGDRANRLPLRGVPVLLLEHHPDRPLPHLCRVLASSRHRSILPTNEASGKPGAVQIGAATPSIRRRSGGCSRWPSRPPMRCPGWRCRQATSRVCLPGTLATNRPKRSRGSSRRCSGKAHRTSSAGVQTANASTTSSTRWRRAPKATSACPKRPAS